MQRREIEPGLLSIFRLYTLVRLVVMPVLAGFYYFRYPFTLEPGLIGILILFVLDVVGLLLILSVHWFELHLGRYYLPLALVASGALPIIEVRSGVTLFAATSVPDFWLVFPFAVVPLILTAWQYGFRIVMYFVSGLAALEAAYLLSCAFTSRMHALYSWASLLGRAAILMLIGHIVTTLMTEQREQRQALLDANRQLMRYAATLEHLAVSRERNRLARELHDTLAHTLSALAVQLDASIALWEQAPARAREMVGRALSTARSGLDETRRALTSLRAAPLVDLGLALSVQTLAESAADRGGLMLEMSLDERLEGLPSEVEQTFYRVAQEALDNVTRHAMASRVAVTLRRQGQLLMLQISDNGGGIAEGPAEDRYGMKGMAERAQLIGATLEIQSTTEGGTVVRLVKELER
jgi:signal transduction histidine kinase